MATKKTNTTGTKTPVAEAVKTEAVKAAAEVKADAAKAVKAVEKVAEKAVWNVMICFFIYRKNENLGVSQNIEN